MGSSVLLDLPVKRGCAILGSVNAKEPARACAVLHTTYVRTTYSLYVAVYAAARVLLGKIAV